MSGYLKNVALVGASGNLGSHVLDSILKQRKHNVTVISRPESSARFPDSITVKKGAYSDAAFLESAFAGQDIVILMLSFAAAQDEPLLIDAAAKAGVKYFIPSEWGAATMYPELCGDAPLLKAKLETHRLIEKLGMKWISVVTNPWLDYCLQYGIWDIEIPDREVTIRDDSGPFITNTIPFIAANVAKFLALPMATINKEYGNYGLFLSEFCLTQPQLFAAVLHATGTTEADWKVKHESVEVRIAQGRKRLAEGDALGNFDVIIGTEIKHGDYSEYVNSQRLEVPKANLEQVVKQAAGTAFPGGFAALVAGSFNK